MTQEHNHALTCFTKCGLYVTASIHCSCGEICKGMVDIIEGDWRTTHATSEAKAQKKFDEHIKFNLS